ncbi:MAG: NFACT RNA binding domain-containing protein [Candidatus Woesearchaeota archaeon]|jgi:predicted ribosome quality control (RQC) complex YloA/Tae2 family protein|nr:NFACT RNA binding domain-containing protein [Candidatus Woesearchaeota archaeon]MDP7182149.1 NFACT RNA binding domain-containing protein [Candidatus Woesearchaeota archaeon]MDP7199071.1 NFACT RNA binding domain-containing protein [Candidatus Woesearchaeota archaeon]MDP7467781.1 NFACT RNA binding domain-containing protein [Candidatus Woesearchaeota archaeon]MDP7646484.1 NFACT RNA binding domain-containing protein [Candidatus Woesearchaeota archaeon]
MMEIKLDFTKSLEVNAARYYEGAKRARKKRERAILAMDRLKNKAATAIPKKKTVRTKAEWYDRFHWFVSSDGVLCVGGRNAESNDAIVKTHVEAEETVCHTVFAGSPFFVIKGEATKTNIEEASIATGVFSRGWKLGMAFAEVHIMKGHQLKKAGPHGESLKKGSFYVDGSRETQKVELKCAVGVVRDKVTCGPVAAMQKNAKKIVELSLGIKNKEDTAKRVAEELGVDMQAVYQVLPSGGFS